MSVKKNEAVAKAITDLRNDLESDYTTILSNGLQKRPLVLEDAVDIFARFLDILQLAYPPSPEPECHCIQLCLDLDEAA